MSGSPGPKNVVIIVGVELVGQQTLHASTAHVFGAHRRSHPWRRRVQGLLEWQMLIQSMKKGAE